MHNHCYLTLLLIVFLISCSTGEIPEPQEVASPAASGSELPALFTDDTGTVFLSWVEETGRGDSVALQYARWTGEGWSSPAAVAYGDDWFVNWADFPMVAGRGGEPLAAHWLHKVPGGPYSYNVRMRMNRPEAGWGEPLTPHDDGTPTEHGFVSLLPHGDRSVLAIWLDGRRTDGRAAEEYSDLDKAMSLRSAVVSDDGTVSERAEIDAAICDCCQTALAGIPGGAIAAYRDRTGEEIRDIYISRYLGGQWSEPVPVHRDGWRIGGCPVNGPVLASSDSTVVLAWYTGADDDYRVRAALSRDAGATFGDPIDLDGGDPVGRVGAAIAENGQVFVSWMEKETDSEARLMVRRIDDSGADGPALSVAPMAASRSSGFPAMTASGNTLFFAWTTIGEEKETGVQTAMIRL